LIALAIIMNTRSQITTLLAAVVASVTAVIFVDSKLTLILDARPPVAQ